MTTAAVYCRISQDDGTALGVKRQEADCTALVERKGWTVGETYTDNDASAYSGRERPAYRRMLQDVKNGLRDAVVVWHPDRLHRSPRELEDFIDIIEATGAAVASCTAGDYDLSTPDGRLMARIVGSVARKESEDKSRRLRRKHQELAAAGKIPGGGRRPFGFEPDRRTIRRGEAKVIREAAKRLLAGESLRSVAADWNERGIDTVTGAPWSPTTLKRMMRSGRISGQREHRREIVADAEWPAIIPKEQTAMLRAVLDDPTRGLTPVTTRSYLLTGFLVCGRCRAKMTTRPTAKGVRRYVCSRDRGGCGRLGIAAQPLEELVTEAIMVALDTPALAAAVSESERDENADVVADIEAAEARLIEYADLYDEGKIGRAEWMRLRDRAEARRQKLHAQLVDGRRESVLEGLEGGALRKTWKLMSLDRRRAVIAAVIDTITIAPTTRASNYFDPDRVEIVWKV